jgi:hypothetical protein
MVSCMKLRARFAIAAAAFFLAACHGALSSSSVVPAALTRADARPRAGNAIVLLTLPPIVTAKTVLSPGIVPIRLSSATASVGGTFGSSKIGPVALTAQTPGCSVESDGLHCVIAISVPAGSNLLTARTFASPDGSGKPLAIASEQLSVFAGSQNYASPKTWIGQAATLKIGLSKKNFRQGVPSSTTISFYGIDAGGAIIPSNVVAGPTRKRVTAQLKISGAYPQTIALPSNAPFTSVVFPYDGRLSGTMTIAAIPTSTTSKTIFATTSMRLLPGPAERGQLFVYGAPSSASSNDTLMQFAAGVSGNAAPLRTYTFGGPPLEANGNGEFWAGPIKKQSFNIYSPSWIEKYDAQGNGVFRLTPSTGGLLFGAAVDPSENVYTIESDIDIYGECSLDGPTIQVYSAGRGWKVSRSVAVDFDACYFVMAADAQGHAFVAYYDPGSYYSPGAEAGLEEYGSLPNQSFGIIRRWKVPPSGAGGLAVDSHGDIFISYGTTLYEFPHGSHKMQPLALGTPVGSFALDAHDNIYVSGPTTIKVFAPGATTPMRTISLPAQPGQAAYVISGLAAGP